MDIWTGVALAVALCIALWIPYFFIEIRRGKARGHTWFTWWRPRGHADIGPDVAVGTTPGKQVFSQAVPRQTRPGADEARGARY